MCIYTFTILIFLYRAGYILTMWEYYNIHREWVLYVFSVTECAMLYVYRERFEKCDFTIICTLFN